MRVGVRRVVVNGPQAVQFDAGHVDIFGNELRKRARLSNRTQIDGRDALSRIYAAPRGSPTIDHDSRDFRFERRIAKTVHDRCSGQISQPLCHLRNISSGHGYDLVALHRRCDDEWAAPAVGPLSYLNRLVRTRIHFVLLQVISRVLSCRVQSVRPSRFAIMRVIASVSTPFRRLTKRPTPR